MSLDTSVNDTSMKVAFICGGIGLVVGIAGGVYLGEAINEHVEVFKQVPAMTRYGIDVAFAGLFGGFGASIGASISQTSRFYKIFNRE